MNADLSVAPEIAQLAGAFSAPSQTRATTPPRTVGRSARDLAELAAAPQLWWDLVRFDPNSPARIPVPGAVGAWLLVLPPGGAADCDCGYATLLAGEAAETTGVAAAAPLRAGRVRVHGSRAPHRVRGADHGYSVSLHMAAATVRSGE